MKRRYRPSLTREQRRRRRKALRWLWLCLLPLLWLGLILWRESARSTARWAPDYDLVPLEELSSLEGLRSEDYEQLFQQTGLTELGLSRLEEAGRLGELALFQRAFFLDAEETAVEEAALLDLPFSYLPMVTFQNSIISWEEYILSPDGVRGAYLPMVPVEPGDILLTPNSRCFGWRQGHSALVLTEDVVLESLVLGQNSSLQGIQKWQGFPAVLVLRPKNADLAETAAAYGEEFLLDVPYWLTVGGLSPKYTEFGTEVKGTNCSHLIWLAYSWLGLDLDSNGGFIVTPENLSQSQDLELVQVWGVSPELMWSN